MVNFKNLFVHSQIHRSGINEYFQNFNSGDKNNDQQNILYNFWIHNIKTGSFLAVPLV